MFDHPFLDAEKLKAMTMEDLSEKISKLAKAASYYSRNANFAMANQCAFILGNYRAELSRKQRDLLDETSITGAFGQADDQIRIE